MEIAKALVLAGVTPEDAPHPGVSVIKPLVPLANRPILFHTLDALRRAGLLEAAIVSPAGMAGVIRDAAGDGSQWGLGLHYVECGEGAGLDAALTATRSFIGDEPVLVQQVDALLCERIHPHIAAFAGERLDALALRLGNDPGRLHNLPLDGGWMLSERAIDLLLAPNAACSDPVALVRDGGGSVRVQAVDGCLPWLGSSDGLLAANRRLLEDVAPDGGGAWCEASELQGAVAVHPTARLTRSLVRGPAVIGPGAQLIDAYVGPYSSIGADVVIEGAQIEHSIVFPRAELRFVGPRIGSSVIGHGARIVHGFGLPEALRLSVGDGAEVTLT